MKKVLSSLTSRINPLTIVDHLENNLGEFGKAWGLTEKPCPIKVLQFTDQPFPGGHTYVSLGLSDHTLAMSDTRSVRQELVFTCYAHYPEEEISSFMLTFCEFIVRHHQALLRGDVIGPSEGIIKGVDKCAIYASIPTIFPDQFWIFEQTDPPTVLVWLIPLSNDEAQFVKAHGSDKFEIALEAADPDFADLHRESVMLNREPVDEINCCCCANGLHSG